MGIKLATFGLIFSQNKSGNPDDPNIDGIVKFKNGALCIIQACDVQAFLILEMDCIGTKGRLRINHSSFDLEFYKVNESKLFSEYKEISPAPSPISNDIPTDFMVNGVKHLIECLKEGKKSP